VTNIPELVVIGALEAYLILILGLVVFIVLNHKLRIRVKTLTSWLDQLKVKTAALIEERNAGPDSNYVDYLEIEASQTEKQFETCFADKALSFDPANSAEENLITLRYLFLQAEIAASPLTNDAEKWHQISQSLALLITNLALINSTPDSETTTPDLMNKWEELCDAVVYTFEHDDVEARNALINLLQLINSELGFDEIVIPSATGKIKDADGDSDSDVTATNAGESNENLQDPEFAETVQLSSAVMIGPSESPSSPEAIERHNHRIDVEKLKDMTSRQREMIDSLKQENMEANSIISLKTSELDQLQQYFDEASHCIEKLEVELDAAAARTIKLEEELYDVPEMKALIRRFSEESSNMLTCIETLEKENEQLRLQKAG